MVKRKYYAKRSPRGVSNDWEFYEFPSKRDYNDFVKHNNGTRSTLKEVEKFAKRNDQLITVNSITKSECKEIGGIWVKEYIKKDGTIVEGYCKHTKY